MGLHIFKCHFVLSSVRPLIIPIIMIGMASLVLLNDQLIIKVSNPIFEVLLLSDSSNITTITTIPNSTNLKLQLSTTTLIQLINQLEEGYELSVVGVEEVRERSSSCSYILCEKLINYHVWSIDCIGTESNLETILMPSINLFKSDSIKIVGDCWVLYELDSISKSTDIDHLAVIHKICHIKSQQLHFNPSSPISRTGLISIDTLRNSKPSPPYRIDGPVTTAITNDHNDHVYDHDYENAVADPDFRTVDSGLKMITSRVSLKQREVSCLIGKNGDRLNSLRYESQCSIKVLPIDSLDHRSTSGSTTHLQGLTATTLSLSRRDILQSILISGYQSNVEYALKSIQTIIVNYRNSDSKYI